MSSINGYFNPYQYTPTINDTDAGLAYGNGDDFLTAYDIGSLGNGFTGSVSTTTSSGKFLMSGDLSRSFYNPSPKEILVRTNIFSSSIASDNFNGWNSPYQLPYLPYPYYQGVPDMGDNPDAMTVLSASTQVQMDLQTIGAPNAPGFPVIGYQDDPEAIDFLQGTNNFVGSVVPYQPTPFGFGYGYFPINPPNFYYQNYPMPYSPFQHQYKPVNNNPQAVNSLELAQTVRTNTFQLPDYLPTNNTSDAYRFIKAFNRLPENRRVNARNNYSNPTSVDMDILGNTGITSTGGQYKQGVVNNPFEYSNFLTDTNPFETTNTGMVVTNGNNNGKIKGTPVKDYLFGMVTRSNIIDGKGGEDNIIGGSQKDMIKVHQGDQILSDAGDDLMFYDFTVPPTYDASRITFVDAGEGNDTMVFTVDGNPTLESNSPAYTKLQNGLISVLLDGVQILTKNIEKFIVVDKNGNIGGVYKATS